MTCHLLLSPRRHPGPAVCLHSPLPSIYVARLLRLVLVVGFVPLTITPQGVLTN